MVPNYPYFGFPNYLNYMNNNMYYNRPNNILSNMPNSTTNSMPNRNINLNNTINNNFKKPKTVNTPITHATSYQTAKATKNTNLSNIYSIFGVPNVSRLGSSSSCEEKCVPIFTILGLDIYFDDILIICLLFFLYNEKVEDYSIYLALILLLLS